MTLQLFLYAVDSSLIVDNSGGNVVAADACIYVFQFNDVDNARNALSIKLIARTFLLRFREI
jgi:hypothetical protein